jgi:DNA repair exonuclease SbcCD nuclease subunit
MGGIVLFSDSHFANRTAFGKFESNAEFPGCNSRFHVIAKAFRAAVKYANDNNCESIFILGDVFHDRGVIDVPVYNGVYQLFREATEQSIRLVIYPGNHDMVDMRAMHSDKHLHSLFAFERLAHVYDQPTIVQTAYFPVAVLPYSNSSKGVIYKAEQMVKKMSGDIKMLMLHHSVNKAITGPHEWVMPHRLDVDSLPEDYSHIWSGHYHFHQQVMSEDNKRRLWYVGAPVHHDFGERTYVPGFVHVMPDGKWQHIENTESPKFKVISTSDIKDFDEVATSKDYIKIEWQGDMNEIEKIKKDLPENCLVEATNSGVVSVARTSIQTTDSVEGMISKYADAKALVKNPIEIVEHGVILYKGHK